jgi:CO/xanthine dehydrogenase Mo-binding subunit
VNIVLAHHPTVNVPVLWWRSVGHTHSAYVTETLIDELAARANMDPIAYRQKLLNADAKKLRAVLELLEKNAGWRRMVAKNHTMGIACHESFGTAVAALWTFPSRTRGRGFSGRRSQSIRDSRSILSPLKVSFRRVLHSAFCS